MYSLRLAVLYILQNYLYLRTVHVKPVVNERSIKVMFEMLLKCFQHYSERSVEILDVILR